MKRVKGRYGRSKGLRVREGWPATICLTITSLDRSPELIEAVDSEQKILAVEPKNRANVLDSSVTLEKIAEVGNPFVV